MKLLHNTSTQLFQPYPRNDDGEVIGLDPIYQVFTVNQDAEPSYDPATHHLEPTETINLETRTVLRGWNVVENPPIPSPEATPLQVRSFLIRQSISLDTIPALIASAMPEGSAREEALMRWEYALSFPKDYPLVVAVANALSLDLDQAWASILAIE